MSRRMVLTLDELIEEPYASILCYPKTSKSELRRRLGELQRLGVKALKFVGEKKVLNVPVLGKGCVGLVIMAYLDGKRAALKIRRTDADRSTMKREAGMLEVANSLRVGPRLLSVSKDFLLMEFIDGLLFPKWLRTQRGKKKLRAILRDVLEQCWRLDEAGLDHGELSHAPKHIIINGREKPLIVDFETASLDRHPSNVTSICQFLFIGSEIAKMVNAKLGGINRKALIKALRLYKDGRTRFNFVRLLGVCGL
jgi:putative serine/threonine protein kinase